MSLDSIFIDGEFGSRKITEIYTTRLHTRKERDELGNWIEVERELRFKRPVTAAPSGRRFIHYIIDYYVVPIAIFFGALISGLPYVVNPLAPLLIMIAYLTAFEFAFQKTIGKFVTRTIVVDEYGQRPSFGSVVLRSLIRFVPFEPFSCMGTDGGWHDRWTKTYVITESELEEIKRAMRGIS
jgi:uncharacterized RDD family membrane protein YckC